MSAKPPFRATALSRPFWEGTRRGEFLLQYDPQAERYQFQPKPVSIYSPAHLEWRAASGKATLLAASDCHVAASGFESETPYVLVIVRLNEGPRVMARAKGVATASELSVGQAMQLYWGEANGDGHEFMFGPAAPDPVSSS